jgi:hypothetical protein
MKELNEFIAALDKITEGVLPGDDYNDFDLEDPADRDDDEGESFKKMPMVDQLGKILDSQGDDIKNPVRTVTTDDGKELNVSVDQARVLRMLATTDKVKPQIRTQFIRDIQTSNGLIDFLDIQDAKEIPALFVKRYLG